MIKGKMRDWKSELQSIVPRARFNEPLAPYTTFKIGGPADAFVEAQTAEEVLAILRAARSADQKIFLLGWGSNLLVLDHGFRGIVLRLGGDFQKIDFLEGDLVRCGAAVRAPQLVVACAQRGLTGLEPIVGVPGTIGGALAMNAGTRDGEIGPFVEGIEIADPRTAAVTNLSADAMEFSYRHGPLDGRIALSCVLRLKQGSKGDIMAAVAKYQQKRLQTQPIHTFNVGSTFKNPPGRFAAQMIEQLGLKGHAIGGARVSPMHANFIENFAGASARDVLALIDLVQERARATYGVGLELEMKVVGE